MQFMDDPHPSPTDDESLVYWNRNLRRGVADLTPQQRLIEAGWRAVDQAELGKAFCGATTAKVSAIAGVTTGSFFHHFPNAEAFARAMAKELAASLSQTDLEEVSTIASREVNVPTIDLADLVRNFMTPLWEEFVGSPTRLARLRCQMRLWSHYPARTGDEPDAPTVAELLREGYLRSESHSAALWRPALAQSGLEFVEPFSLELMTVLASALLEGLAIRAAIDPENVPSFALGEAIVALVAGVMRPAGVHVKLEGDAFEVTGQPERRSPQARSGAQRRYETRRRIVAACTGMFVDGWESIAVTDVATKAKVSTQTITNLFGSVRAVAAATFAPQAQHMYQNALGRSHEDPWLGLKESLTDLTVRARIEPEVARALLAERINSLLKRGGSLGEMDVRLEVPISGAIGLWLSRLGMVGDDSISVSTTLVNFVLTQAITSEESSEKVAALALRLLPNEVASRRDDPGIMI